MQIDFKEVCSLRWLIRNMVLVSLRRWYSQIVTDYCYWYCKNCCFLKQTSKRCSRLYINVKINGSLNFTVKQQ